MQHHRVPGSNDNVTLPPFQGTYTVSQPSACRDLILSGQSTLSITSTLSGSGTATLDGTINLSGQLSVALGAAATASSNINGQMTWTAGSFSGGSSAFPVMINNTVTISGPATKTLGAFVDVNPGVQIVQQDGNVDDGSATLNVMGTYELQSDASVTSGFGTGGIFNLKNGGRLLKSGGSGVSTVGGNFTISDGARVVDQTGMLRLQLGAFNATVDDTGGTFEVAQGARVILAGGVGGGDHVKLMGTYVGSGRGTVELRTNIAVLPMTTFNFPGPVDPPNGDTSQIINHFTMAENGLSDITAPVNSLVGVFLGPDQPNLTPAPDALDFSTTASRDMDRAPLLKQVFFIGDGRTSAGDLKHVTVPDGATRLFLGTMDGFEWKNDAGAFSVRIGVNGIPLDNSFPFLVPAISDPWLAGMPDGSTASIDDVAPDQSPALIPDLAVNPGDVLTFTSKGSVNFYPSMFEWTSGILFSQSGGALTNPASGSMRIAPSSPFAVNLEAPLNNFGTITQPAGSWLIGASGVLTNKGIYDLQTDGQGIGGSVFNNESDGIFRKSLNAGQASSFFSAFNNHGGVIDVQRGTLDLRGSPGTHTGGIFYTADGTTLIPFSGTFTDTYTGAKAGSGVVYLDVAVTVGSVGAALNFAQDGMLQWRNAQILAGTGGLVNSGSLTLIGSSHHFLTGSGGLTNNGTIIHTGIGGLALPFGTTFVNNGFYDLQGDASVGVQQGGTFQNNGRFIKSQGTGTSTNDHWENNSTGTIDVESGTIRLSDSFTNSGTLIIAAGTTFQVGGAYTQSGTTGKLDVQLGGPPASGQFGQLVVGATATLAGTLQVDLVNGYGGNPGDVFKILTYGSVMGNFNPILPPGAVWDVDMGTVSFPGP
jgi:hypothetical protein